MLRVAVVIALTLWGSPFGSGQPNNADAQLTQPSGPTESTSPRKIRVSGNVMLGMFEHKVMPLYPDEAMLKGIQGDVIFKLKIDETGKVVLATPVDGDSLLVAAGVEALQQCRFRPYLLNGVPIAVETQLGFHFSVEKENGGVSGKVDCITSLPDSRSFAPGSRPTPVYWSWTRTRLLDPSRNCLQIWRGRRGRFTCSSP